MQSPFKVALLPSECVLRMVEYLEKHHLSEMETIMGELDNSDSTHYQISVSMLDLLHDDLLLGWAAVEERGSVFDPADFYAYTAESTTGLAESIQSGAGVR